MNNYYKQKQYVGKVDKNGKHLGYVEKWDAHKKGILHRGFAIILVYKNYYLLQHRKHPAFDAVLDLSSASHQLLKNGKFRRGSNFFPKKRVEFNQKRPSRQN